MKLNLWTSKSQHSWLRGTTNSNNYALGHRLWNIWDYLWTSWRETNTMIFECEGFPGNSWVSFVDSVWHHCQAASVISQTATDRNLFFQNGYFFLLQLPWTEAMWSFKHNNRSHPADWRTWHSLRVLLQNRPRYLSLHTFVLLWFVPETDRVAPLASPSAVQHTFHTPPPVCRDSQSDVATAGERLVPVLVCSRRWLVYDVLSRWDVPVNSWSRFTCGWAAEHLVPELLLPLLAAAEQMTRVHLWYSLIVGRKKDLWCMFGYGFSSSSIETSVTFNFKADLLSFGSIRICVEGTNVTSLISPRDIFQSDEGGVERGFSEDDFSTVWLVYLLAKVFAVGRQVFDGLVPKQPLPRHLEHACQDARWSCNHIC